MFSLRKKSLLRPRAVLHCEILEERTVPSLVGTVTSATSAVVQTAQVAPESLQYFQVTDASHDDSPYTVFAGGALRVNYSVAAPSVTARIATQTGTGGGGPPLPPASSVVDHVVIEAWQNAATSSEKVAYSYGNTGAVAMVKVADLATFRSDTVTDGLVNLLETANLPGGALTIEGRAYFKDGSIAVSSGTTITVKIGPILNGDFRGNTFDLSQISGNGDFINGAGGTDTLNLNVDSKLVASIDGMSLAAFSPTAGGQAIYQGVAVDYIRLTTGREVYFTGIENLQIWVSPTAVSAFVAGVGTPLTPILQTIGLSVTTNDDNFDNQWNLQITDVPDAWRFTTGSNKVLLVSLDTGALAPSGNPGFSGKGISLTRLITDPSDDDNTGEAHAHQAISVMIGTPNDGFFNAGINWVSNVFVTDVYHGVSLQQAIQQAFDFAKDKGLDLVFQGGIQGESWLNSGGSQEDLEKLISSHANALFAIAAGNGGPTGNLNDPNFATSVSGVAKLETNHINVMSVGALQRTPTQVDELANASAVNLAAYSNHGSNLTMVAPTDSPAVDFLGSTIFGGTSCANPNMAAMASLVWSANPLLSGPQVRQILEDTAMDLGAPGRDNTFGYGLVDAGLAVRRATALANDYYLAMLPQYTLSNPGGPGSIYSAFNASTAAFTTVLPTGATSAAAKSLLAPSLSAAASPATKLPPAPSLMTAPLSVVDSVFANDRSSANVLLSPASAAVIVPQTFNAHLSHVGGAQAKNHSTTAVGDDGPLFTLEQDLTVLARNLAGQ
jgi:serine protease